MNDEQLRLFAGWWCATWKWAHPSWLESWADAGVSADIAQRLSTSRHREWQVLLGIEPQQPPMPNGAILQWLTLAEAQRELALNLAQRVCFPGPETTPPHEHEAWCRSIAKGLRPATWLSFDGLPDARVLLGAWVGSAYWQRLLTSWPRADAYGLSLPNAEWPARRVEALWQALIWRVTT